MASSESRPCSHRASWMFTDPYAYQYSDVDAENDDHVDIPPAELGSTSSSTVCELEGSGPTHTLRYELPAGPSVAGVQTKPHINNELSKAPSGLSSNHPSSTRSNVGSSDWQDHVRSLSVHEVSAPFRHRQCPPQPASSGLIPVIEDAPLQSHHYSPVAPPRSIRPSPPGYADGLIPVDANAPTPKEPSSDFDAILRNIGPIPKKKKGNTSRERSSRYYDRYSSNFG
ncbi:hypothetical protein F5Y03DRAFT_156167 [Xylaria venustula]|nr:hypothetical protein F5Y03DRAFT_156167 [Xylaria venustula]